VLVRDAKGRPEFTVGLIEPCDELARLRKRATEAMTAAHDLNNLLVVVFGHQELLLRSLPHDDKRRTDAEAIGRVARMSVPIVESMMGTQTGPLAAVDVNELILGMHDLVRQLVGSDVEIALQLDPTIPHVFVERNHLERSIANIAANARDAMPDGGILRVETTTDGAFVKIGISDTGIGIQPGVRARIFDREFSTKPAGHGIGLAFARETVERAGGYVAVDSELGRGARFTLALPKCATAGE
jgi:signal transduction histidine kinase